MSLARLAAALPTAAGIAAVARLSVGLADCCAERVASEPQHVPTGRAAANVANARPEDPSSTFLFAAARNGAEFAIAGAKSPIATLPRDVSVGDKAAVDRQQHTGNVARQR